MKYIFNTEKLNALVSDFYTSTGIAVTLYDSSMTAVATSPVYSSCCKCIRTKKECVERCNESNFIHMREKMKKRKFSWYALIQKIWLTGKSQKDLNLITQS